MIELKAKEFLLVRDAAVLLNSSRQTIYSLIKAGKIKAKNILQKKTLIPRTEIDKLFQQEPIVPLITLKKPKPPKAKDFYRTMVHARGILPGVQKGRIHQP